MSLRVILSRTALLAGCLSALASVDEPAWEKGRYLCAEITDRTSETVTGSVTIR